MVAQCVYPGYPQEHHIQTSHGPVSVAVFGDLEKPALVTYPDVALNREYEDTTNNLACFFFFFHLV